MSVCEDVLAFLQLPALTEGKQSHPKHRDVLEECAAHFTRPTCCFLQSRREMDSGDGQFSCTMMVGLTNIQHRWREDIRHWVKQRSCCLLTIEIIMSLLKHPVKYRMNIKQNFSTVFRSRVRLFTGFIPPCYSLA